MEARGAAVAEEAGDTEDGAGATVDGTTMVAAATSTAAGRTNQGIAATSKAAAAGTMVADGMLLRLRGKAIVEAMAMVVVEAGPSNAVDYLQEKMSMRVLCQSVLTSYQTSGRSRGLSTYQGR